MNRERSETSSNVLLFCAVIGEVVQINPKEQDMWDVVNGDGYAIFDNYAESRKNGVVEDSVARPTKEKRHRKIYLVKLKAK